MPGRRSRRPQGTWPAGLSARFCRWPPGVRVENHLAASTFPVTDSLFGIVGCIGWRRRHRADACCLAGTAAPAQPAAQPHAGPGLGAEISPGQVKKEEAEEDNVYRHTPLVQKLANTFHLDIETTARLFEFINFAIIALAIIIPLVKFLPRVIRKRSDHAQPEPGIGAQDHGRMPIRG